MGRRRLRLAVKRLNQNATSIADQIRLAER
jgi:hypothetical protein